MIVGNGDIATALTDSPRGGDDSLLFFASGVSNSQETRVSEYQREKDLLLSQPRDKRLVYFGTLSVFYKNDRYQQHKIEMEDLVRKNFSKWNIIRLGNITWGTNPHTIINFFKIRVKEREPIQIQEGTRYIVDREEFNHWINLIPDWNCEMSLIGQPMSIEEIVREYVL